jgi:glycerophosphoryl diester phosphodiesterase
VTDPWVIAHRGGPAAGVEENSLAAFAAAHAAGAEMVELDVRRSGDGRLVVVHDATVAGLGVRRTPLAALRSATGLELPELSTVVDFAAGRLGLDAELKEPGYEEEVLAALRPASADDPPLLVTSFFTRVLRRVRACEPGIDTGLLVRTAAGRLPRRLATSGARYLLPPASALRRGVLDAAARAGVPAIPWTVNAPGDLRHALGHPAVAGVITDLPELALRTRSEQVLD